MSPSFSSEVARQRRTAQDWLRAGHESGDEFLVEVASARLAELDELNRRLDPTS